jgi:hypothetical protein
LSFFIIKKLVCQRGGRPFESGGRLTHRLSIGLA